MIDAGLRSCQCDCRNGCGCVTVFYMNGLMEAVAILAVAFAANPRPAALADGAAADTAPGAADTIVLAGFPMHDMPIERWLRENGWKEDRGSADDFAVRDGTLFMRSSNATTVIGRKLAHPVEPSDFPFVEFSFMVNEIPPGADVTSKRADDAAFRLFLVFDTPRGLFSPPRTIGYVWDSTLKTSSTGRSARVDNVRYFVIGSGTEGLGRWTICRRDIAADYRLLFGDGPVPKVAAVALKCDTNHTKGRAASAVQWIRLLRTGAGEKEEAVE